MGPVTISAIVALTIAPLSDIITSGFTFLVLSKHKEKGKKIDRSIKSLVNKEARYEQIFKKSKNLASFN